MAGALVGSSKARGPLALDVVDRGDGRQLRAVLGGGPPPPPRDDGGARQTENGRAHGTGAHGDGFARLAE